MPTFASPNQRQQADQLLQPVLIRVVDNLRKAQESTNWVGTYEEHLLWPEGTTADQQAQVQQIAAQLDEAEGETAQSLRAQLSHLPIPFPGYKLHLTQGDRTAHLDVWALCYQVCFTQYNPLVPAEVDPALRGADGDIDWLALDEKARQVVQAAFDQLSC